MDALKLSLVERKELELHLLQCEFLKKERELDRQMTEGIPENYDMWRTQFHVTLEARHLLEDRNRN